MSQHDTNVGNQEGRRLVIIGILGAIAVVLGAFGAHTLKSKLSSGLITPDQLNGFDTAVKYQMYHTLAMLAVVLLGLHAPNKYLKFAYGSFLAGIVLFSGSLYLLCTRYLMGATWLGFLGPITPVGGLFFIGGWICLVLAAAKKGR